MRAARPACFALLLAFALQCLGQGPGRPLSPALEPYTNCKLPGGPDVVQVTPLPVVPGTRELQTVQGPRTLKMLDGVRVTFAYPDTDFYANVKAEELPADSYAGSKADLLSEEDKIIASSESVGRNDALKPALRGFEVSGLDAKKLEGNVLGIYLLFDDASHVVTTIYFLNAEVTRRKFDSVPEYATLRDKFLQSYTACVRGNI